MCVCVCVCACVYPYHINKPVILIREHNSSK